MDAYVATGYVAAGYVLPTGAESYWVDSVDYPNKRIYLSSNTMGVDLDTVDVYNEVVQFRTAIPSQRQYPALIRAGGNIEKVAGVSYTLPYVQLLDGCRLVPYDASHVITLIRDTFTDDGFAGRDCFDRTSLTPGVAVDVDVDIQEVEIRVVSVGGANIITGDVSTVLAAIPSAVVNAAAVRTELATELARIDAPVSGATAPSAATVAAAVASQALGARTLGQHIQAIAATALGETGGAGTAHMSFTDGAVTVEADVPLPGEVGDRTNVVITGV